LEEKLSSAKQVWVETELVNAKEIWHNTELQEALVHAKQEASRDVEEKLKEEQQKTVCLLRSF